MAQRICSIEQCPKPHYARGWCEMHYQRWRLYGDPLVIKRGFAGAGSQWDLTVKHRFLSRVDENGPTIRPDLGPCRIWTGPLGWWGYGRFAMPKGQPDVAPSRAAWILFVGPIPLGMAVCHHCDNPPCVRWESHLFLGTPGDNAGDMIAKGRGRNQGKDCCPAGHAYDETNTYYAPVTGWRQCKTCRRLYQRALRARRATR